MINEIVNAILTVLLSICNFMINIISLIINNLSPFEILIILFCICIFLAWMYQDKIVEQLRNNGWN